MKGRKKVDAAIKDYIETQILPRYGKISGHTTKHINQVIDRSLTFADSLDEANVNMVYVIAAYHDLGREINDEHHETESAKLLLADQELKKYFTTDELKIMAEAVEDHRASSKHDPRSIYGKIVSSADRNISVDEILERCYDCVRALYPDMSDDEVIEECRVILRSKYSPTGYAASRMYFKDSDFENFLQKTEEITRDPATFREIQRDFNRHRGILSD